ncbi:guanine nucleotide-binding protein G(i) subunit alpha-like [Pecten maximus]|uniref:guanine nucleotide-binding protein G(i) subunit alpha-like n=1 Tax=Pecten maximus TaxID=6579 RepID=UPI0014582AEC|nr:guanine nucleotide-binding protein G(i) subunit alpha-like [Pecten maximus]
MVDVGGQRSERRKWIHCFDNVTAIIFVTAMTFYHQMNDSSDMNKLHESLLIFKSLCANQYLHKSAFLVFLNKMDIFKVMIQRKSLKCCFPRYKGGKSFIESAQYISCLFENASRRNSGVYCHYTTATDTENFDRVFDTSMAILLEKNLAVTGLL